MRVVSDSFLGVAPSWNVPYGPVRASQGFMGCVWKVIELSSFRSLGCVHVLGALIFCSPHWPSSVWNEPPVHSLMGPRNPVAEPVFCPRKPVAFYCVLVGKLVFSVGDVGN